MNSYNHMREPSLPTRFHHHDQHTHINNIKDRFPGPFSLPKLTLPPPTKLRLVDDSDRNMASRMSQQPQARVSGPHEDITGSTYQPSFNPIAGHEYSMMSIPGEVPNVPSPAFNPVPGQGYQTMTNMPEEDLHRLGYPGFNQISGPDLPPVTIAGEPSIISHYGFNPASNQDYPAITSTTFGAMTLPTYPAMTAPNYPATSSGDDHSRSGGYGQGYGNVSAPQQPHYDYSPEYPHHGPPSSSQYYSQPDQDHQDAHHAPSTNPPQYHPRQHTSSAFSEFARPDEDWTKIEDPKERRRYQNRVSQRKFRANAAAKVDHYQQRWEQYGHADDYTQLEFWKEKLNGGAARKRAPSGGRGQGASRQRRSPTNRRSPNSNNRTRNTGESSEPSSASSVQGSFMIDHHHHH